MSMWTLIVGLLALLSGSARLGIEHPLLDSAFAVLLTGFVVLLALVLLRKDCDHNEELS